jgi:hypothetical protein
MVRERVLQLLPGPNPPVSPAGQWDWRTPGTASAIGWRESTLAWLADHCRFRDAGRVKRFLRRHAGLLELLSEAYPVLQQHFGSRPWLAAEVIGDPESEGDDDVLFVYVRTALTPEAALEALAGFDADWFLGELGRAGGRLNFSLEFV